ncbi:hypothetical protein [Paraburkholderia sp. CI3]|uniref:hypothetical protein n=1 Tax=Paraburkholderia sp. CI3 TaxID=2991060 RepID=UPI003D21FF17
MASMSGLSTLGSAANFGGATAQIGGTTAETLALNSLAGAASEKIGQSEMLMQFQQAVAESMKNAGKVVKDIANPA